MIIVDTSIWVDHFRQKSAFLQELIGENQIALHPFVYGELLLGGLPVSGTAAINLLKLAQLSVASASEAAAFIEWAQLSGTGVGYVDIHLLLSAKVNAECYLLTADKSLRAQAERLGVCYQQ